MAARLPIMAEKAKLALPPALDSKEPDLGVVAEAIRDPRVVEGGASSDFEDRSREDGDPSGTTFRVSSVVEEVAAKHGGGDGIHDASSCGRYSNCDVSKRGEGSNP